MEKIFIIGFNRCGTTFLNHNFLLNNLKSYSYKYGNKIIDDLINDNIKNNKKYFNNINFDVLSDSLFIHLNYDKIHKLYPNAYYILNTRNINDWICSRLNFMGPGEYINYYNKSNNTNHSFESIIKIWKNEWIDYHNKVKEYFNNNDKFMIYNIDNDKFEDIMKFIKYNNYNINNIDNFRNHTTNSLLLNKFKKKYYYDNINDKFLLKDIKEKYGIYTTVNNEINIIEWILYHFSIGFNYILINDDNSNPSVKDIVSNYNKGEFKYFLNKKEGEYLKNKYGNINLNKLDIITYYKEYDVKPGYLLKKKYWDYILNILKQKTEYVLSIDGDEYLTINNNKKINEILIKYDNFDVIKINWLFFGNNNHKKIESNLLLKSFTKSHNELNRHVKCLAKTEKIISCENPHYFILTNNCIIKNILDKITDNSPFEYNIKDYPNVDMYISHFMVQDTYRFFTRRFLKNTSNFLNIKRDKNDRDKLTLFFKNNLHNIIDYIYDTTNTIKNINTNNNEYKNILKGIKDFYNSHNLNTNDNLILCNY